MIEILDHTTNVVNSTRCASVDKTASRRTNEKGETIKDKYGNPVWTTHPTSSFTVKTERYYLVQCERGADVEIMTKMEMRKTFGAKHTSQALDRYSQALKARQAED